MRKMLLGITVLLFMVSIGYCQDQPLQLTIKSDKQVYEVGEAIWIQVTIRNESERKQILSDFGFIVSSGNIKNPICTYSPVKFLDNTFDDNPYKREVTTLQSKEQRVLKYNLYDLKWDDIFSSLWASKPFNKYINPGKYSVSFDSIIVDEKDYDRPHLTSNTITIKVTEKKGISKEEALNIAEKICKESGWEWKDVSIRENGDKWSIITNAGARDMNAFIDINKKTGKVLRKDYNAI